MKAQINEQGLKNIYWKNFEKTGKINDFLAYANHQRGIMNGKDVSDNQGFSGSVNPSGGFQ